MTRLKNISSDRVLLGLFAGHPVWWLLGLTLPATIFAVGLLAVRLWHRGLRWPHGSSWWLLFLAWVLIGVLVVQVDAPYAVHGWNTNRFFTWAFRLLWYVGATVVMLHVANREERPGRRPISQIFGWMFVWCVVGGYLGMLLPTLDFPSVAEVLLPHGLAANAFVSSQVHPVLAEQMLYAGQFRPSAPFPFANVWGLNVACFLPFFVHGWCGRTAGRSRRRVGIAVVVLSVVPVVMSLNRGLWLALGVMFVLLLVRAATGGNVRLLVGALLVPLILLGVIVATPLRDAIANRFSSPNSNDGRTELALRGFASVNSSPVVGFGTPRPVQGSLSSIAGGATASCPRCQPPALGTQGQIYLTTFSDGWVGGAFYLVFLLVLLGRGLRRRGPETGMALAVLVAHLSTQLVYSADNLAILPIFAACGVLGRRRAGDPLPAVLRIVKDRPRWVLAGVVAGTAAGGAVAVALPPGVQMRTSVLVSGAEDAATATSSPLDQVAQFAADASVTRRIAAASGTPASDVAERLSVTAIPNTNVLQLTYLAPTARSASAGARAAATGVLRLRERQVDATHRAEARAVDGRLAGIRDALTTVGGVRQQLGTRRWGPAGHAALRELQADTRWLAKVWRRGDRQRDQLTMPSARPSAGVVLGPALPATAPTPWAATVATGCGAGLLGGLILAHATRTPRRMRGRIAVPKPGGLIPGEIEVIR